MSTDRIDIARDRSRVDANHSGRTPVAASDLGAIGAHPGARITMYLDHYLLAGRLEYFACFACGTAVEPKPVRATDTHGRERRCGGCGLEAALPLQVAVSEGWLHVMDAEGRVLNDTRQVGPA